MENNKTKVPSTERMLTRSNMVQLLKEIKEWFGDLFDLEEGASKEKTIIAIRNNKKMRGANAWLLMCSIMIASLGLDLNSAAVIIGAMLISPLMSPILGIGLSVGINDREMLFSALQHFGIAIIIALVTSTLYFSITPLGQPTDQILQRTAPNLLDGLIGVFGGLAGIISITRKDPSNAIPGVAIATALMPPLCVTGFGLATRNVDVAVNSFYLFFLNSFFIALTTYVIIKLLRFPLKTHMNPKEASRTRAVVLIFSILISIPSINILMDLYTFQTNKGRAELFAQENFAKNAIDFSYVEGEENNQLIVELLGLTISQDTMEHYNKLLVEKYNLDNITLSFVQNEGIGLDEIGKMQIKLSNLEQISQNLDAVNETKNEQAKELENLKVRMDSLQRHSQSLSTIIGEVRAIFPKVEELGYTTVDKIDIENQKYTLPLVILKWNKTKRRQDRIRDNKKLTDFFQHRLGLDTLQVLEY